LRLQVIERDGRIWWTPDTYVTAPPAANAS